MEISIKHRKDDESGVVFDISDIDYDMMTIFLQGLEKKLIKISSRKSNLSIVLLETYDSKTRKEFKSQIKFLNELEKKVTKSISKIKKELDYT